VAVTFRTSFAATTHKVRVAVRFPESTEGARFHPAFKARTARDKVAVRFPHSTEGSRFHPAFRAQPKGKRVGFAAKFTVKKFVFRTAFASARTAPSAPPNPPPVSSVFFIMRGAVISPASIVYWQVTNTPDPTGIHSGYFGNIQDIVIEEVYGGS
jgi:hypothetical protein